MKAIAIYLSPLSRPTEIKPAVVLLGADYASPRAEAISAAIRAHLDTLPDGPQWTQPPHCLPGWYERSHFISYGPVAIAQEAPAITESAAYARLHTTR